MLWKLNFITIWVSNLITEFWAEDENKIDLRKQSLIHKEWHLAVEVPTSVMAHAERERENTPTKQQQGKTWATKAQQDLPINVAITSQLLACKASWDKLYTMPNPR
jgi:hypothetical protein